MISCSITISIVS